MSDVAQELLKRADVIGAWLSGTAVKAADFATTQAIDIAMQYVLFGRVHLTAIVILAVLGIIVSIWIGKRMLNVTDGGSIILGGFGFVFCTFILLVNMKSFFLVWAAPKVWLMFELTQLAKGVN